MGKVNHYFNVYLLNLKLIRTSNNGNDGKNKSAAGDLNEITSFRIPLIFVKQILIIFISLSRYLANPFKKEKLFKEFLNV